MAASNRAGTADALKARATTAANPAAEVAPVDISQAQPVNTIKALFERQRDEIERALPAHMSADRLARVAFTVIRNNDDLARCTAASLLGALMTCAQLGLEPGPLGHAYFLPFKGEVTFVIGYKGMIELAHRSGMLASPPIAREVYEGDHFRFEYGVDDVLEHRPTLGERGKIRCYYAVAKYPGGGYSFVVLSPADIESFRERSKSPNSPAWRNDYLAMAKKTCIRRLFTYLPTSVEIRQAMAQDGNVRTDLTADGLDVVPPFIEGEVADEPAADTTTGEVLDIPPADPVGDPKAQAAEWPTVPSIPTGGTE